MRKLLLSSAFFMASTAALCAETEYRVCVQDGEAMLFGFTADGDEIIINVVGLEEQGGVVRRSKRSALMIDLGFQVVVFSDEGMTTVSKSGRAETAPCYHFELGQFEAMNNSLAQSIMAAFPTEKAMLETIDRLRERASSLEVELAQVRSNYERFKENSLDRQRAAQSRLNTAIKAQIWAQKQCVEMAGQAMISAVSCRLSDEQP